MGRELLRQRELLRHILRDIRKCAGINQSDLAAKLGMPQSFVSKYESGERRLDLIEIRIICRALNVQLGDFIKRFEGDLNGAQ